MAVLSCVCAFRNGWSLIGPHSVVLTLTQNLRFPFKSNVLSDEDPLGVF